MNISASQLVKRSASQLLFKELKRLQWKPTDRQLKGNAYADAVVLKEEASSEKRGIVKLDDDLLFFCIDLVKDNKFVEIKMVENQDDYEPWYLFSSIMQSTFYATLLTQVETLNTPSFRKKEGYPQEVIRIPDNFKFELWFGDEKYQVYPNDRIMNHYFEKARIIKSSIKTMDYDTCKKFDSVYKFNEFKLFMPKYTPINK